MIQYIPPPPKPNVLEELNAQLAPYLPPGSDRESAFFKNISRADQDRISTLPRKGLVDVNYEPRMTHVRKKPVCFVRIDPATTVKKVNRKARDICSKGASECRHSNIRMAQKLDRLHALSPKIEEYSLSQYNAAAGGYLNEDSNTNKPGSQMTFRGAANAQIAASLPSGKKGNASAPKKVLKKVVLKSRHGDRSSSMLLGGESTQMRE